jgi:hypothetical protein
MFRVTAGSAAGRLHQSRSMLAVFFISVIVTSGCEQPTDPRKTNFKVAKDNVVAAYDPKSGQLRKIEVDQDRNGTFETVSTWDGNQLKLIAIDTNNDKLTDRWEHYEGVTAVMTKVGSSSLNDATEDVWTYLGPDGKSIKTIERDTNRDGRVDKWEEFNPPSTAGGSPVLRRVGYDHRGTGKATNWLYYGPTGQFERVEAIR